MTLADTKQEHVKVRLTTRLVLTVVVIQALMLFAIVWNSVRLMNVSYADLMNDSIHSETHLLANSLAPGLAYNDRATVEDVLTLLSDKKSLVYILVYNSNNTVMAGLGSTVKGEPDSNYEQALHDGVYDVDLKIELAGQYLGHVSVGYSLEHVENIIRDSRTQNTIIAIAGLMVSLLVTLFISLFMTRGLRKLEDGAYALKRGELDTQVEVNSSDEIGAVAHAMNQLAEHLNKTEFALHQKHEALKRETRYLQTLLNGISAIIIEAKPPGFQFSYVSKEAKNLLGYSVNQWFNKDFWIEHVYEEDKVWTLGSIEDNIRDNSSFSMDYRLMHKLGHMIWVRSITSVEIDDNNEVIMRGLIIDITEQKSAESRIVYLAEHDSLTGLINRRKFQEELEKSIAFSQRYQQQGAVLFIDIDQFKYINDTYGHQYGDEYLMDVARRLTKVLRKTDILGRLGGDEFGVIIPNLADEQATTVASSILNSLSQGMLEYHEKVVHLSASIGIAFYPRQCSVASDLLAKADAAMYTAKNNGRNQFHVFSENDDELWNMQAKVHWEERIRWALENDRFVLHFQPVMDLMNNRVAHFEVLLRMLGKDDDLILPSAFIDTAERFGLIREIDRWVLRNAIKAQAVRRERGEEVDIAVNISGRHFGSMELMLLVREAMQNYGADPSRLMFEVTETAAVENLSEARSFIDSLRTLGCRFALDDFGSGFSSFHYLRNLPVDFVKIDGSFVRNLHRDEEDRVFVKAMVDLAQGLGITCIAEFVENAEIVEVLKELGVQLGQGYYLAPPQADTLSDGSIHSAAG